MERSEITSLIESIIADYGVPRKIKDSLAESLNQVSATAGSKEHITHLISVLDDASSSPNLSLHARTHIWNIVSALEGEVNK